MIVHTHIEIFDTKYLIELTELLELWNQSWKSNGFDTVITTNEYIDEKHTQEIIGFNKVIAEFPSVNKKGFDFSAFRRWLAAKLVAEENNKYIITTECDLINYNIKPNDIQIEYDKLAIARPDGCPVFSIGNANSFASLVDMISKHEINNTDTIDDKPHISDQNFICKYFKYTSSYKELDNYSIQNVFCPGWKTSDAVHYGTPFFLRNNIQYDSKVSKIRELRPLNDNNSSNTLAQ